MYISSSNLLGNWASSTFANSLVLLRDGGDVAQMLEIPYKLVTRE